MLLVDNNLVFRPENINTSSESGISIILRNQEFLTSKASEVLLYEDDDLANLYKFDVLFSSLVNFYLKAGDA